MDVQLATAVGATDTPLLETTIDENFRATVAAHGDREALVVRHQGIRWTYDELDTRVDELARALLAGGLEVGDRVAIWSPNRYEWVLTQYATARIGAIITGQLRRWSTRWGQAQGLEYVAQARVVSPGRKPGSEELERKP